MSTPAFRYAGPLSPLPLQPIDQIPLYMSVLQELDPAKAASLTPDVEAAWLQDRDEQTTDSQDFVAGLRNTLQEALSAAAPNGYRFGAREGHGTDLGFWEENNDEPSDGTPHRDRPLMRYRITSPNDAGATTTIEMNQSEVLAEIALGNHIEVVGASLIEGLDAPQDPHPILLELTIDRAPLRMYDTDEDDRGYRQVLRMLLEAVARQIFDGSESTAIVTPGGLSVGRYTITL